MNNEASEAASNYIITRPYSQKNMDFAHAQAIVEDEARGAEVVTVTASGLVITRAMLDNEIRSTRVATPRFGQPSPMVIGLNASVSMYA